jgi:hypothetical protein
VELALNALRAGMLGDAFMNEWAMQKMHGDDLQKLRLKYKRHTYVGEKEKRRKKREEEEEEEVEERGVCS